MGTLSPMSKVLISRARNGPFLFPLMTVLGSQGLRQIFADATVAVAVQFVDVTSADAVAILEAFYGSAMGKEVLAVVGIVAALADGAGGSSRQRRNGGTGNSSGRGARGEIARRGSRCPLCGRRFGGACGAWRACG